MKLFHGVIVMLVLLALAIFATPAFGQRGGHGGGGSHPGHARGPVEQSHNQHVQQNREAYRGHVDANHYHNEGIRRDRIEGYDRFYGPNHHFFWYHSRWAGPRYCVGSRFYFGSYWFMIVDPVPDFWGDDDVYVTYDDGFYFLFNQRYGTRIRIDVW